MSETDLARRNDDLFRSALNVSLRADDPAAADDAPAGPVLFGHFIRFNEWTEIRSGWEGHFLERFTPGSCRKTLKENAARIRCLFQHGMDFYVGDKPLGPWDRLEEDDEGVYYEVPLLDAGYVRQDILPGLEAGLYGASVRFSVLREEWVEEPGVSDHNPDGIPERTVKECRIYEGGPVTFPAYANASAAVRSLTDEFQVLRFMRTSPERVRELMLDPAAPGRPAPEAPAPAHERAADPAEQDAPSTADAAPERTSAPERREHASRRRPLALPTRSQRAGLTLNTEKEPTWPLR